MTIEEKAKEIIPDAFDADEILPAREGFIVKYQRLAFHQGAEWVLENAVRWLKANAKDFSDNTDELIKQFEEAMEE